MRKLGEGDRDRLWEYISAEPEINLFLIGDLEGFGLESGEVSFYAAEEGEDWDFLVLRYFDYFILYSRREDYDAGAAAGFLREMGAREFAGKTCLVRRLLPYFPELSLHSTYMSRCDRVECEFAAPDGLELRLLGADEVEEAVDLYLLIDEFAKTYRDRREEQIEQAKVNLAHGGMIMGGWIHGRLVAVAGTSADNSMSAMIVGVATRPDARRLGYASAVTAGLCRAAFRKGKEFLCLFYDNPEAGRIYHRLGFGECGEYGMVR